MWRTLIAYKQQISLVLLAFETNTSLNLATGHCELNYRIALYPVSLGCYTITRYRRQGLKQQKQLIFSSFWRLGVQDQVPAALVSAKTSPCPAGGRLLTVLSHGLFSVAPADRVSSNEWVLGFLPLPKWTSPCDLTTYLLRSSISQNGHIAS